MDPDLLASFDPLSLSTPLPHSPPRSPQASRSPSPQLGSDRLIDIETPRRIPNDGSRFEVWAEKLHRPDESSLGRAQPGSFLGASQCQPYGMPRDFLAETPLPVARQVAPSRDAWMKAMPKNLFGSLSDASLEEACEQSLPEMAIAKTGTPEEHTPREAAGIGSRPEPPKDMAAGAGDTGSPVGYAKPCPSTASYAGEAVCGAPSKESGAAMLEKPEVKQLSAFELALNASDDEDENEDEDGQVSGGAQTRSSDFEESQGTPAEVSHSAAGGTCRSDQSGLSSGNSADNTDKETFLPSQELLEKLDDKSTRREDEGLHQYAQLHQYPEESQLGIDVKNLSGAEADTAGELGICAPGVTMHSSPHLTVVNSPTVSTAHYEEPSLVADSAPACLPDSAESSPHTNHDDLPTDNPSICAGVVSPSFTGSASPQGPLDSSPMSSHPALPGLLDESEPDWVVEAEAAQKAQANVAELQQLESQPAGERFSPREVAPSKPHQTPPQGTLELDPGAARSTQIPDPSPTPPEETSATGSCDCSSSAAKILSPERQAIADRFAALQTPADGAASFTGSAFARLAAEVGKQRESKETGEVAAVHSSSRLDHQSDYLLEGPNRTQEVVHGESPTPPLLRMREHEVGADKALHALGTKRSHIGSSPSRERPSASLLSPLKRAVTANARKSPDKGTSDPASLPLPVSPIKWIDGDLDASMDLMGDSSFLAAANVSLGDDSFDLGRLLLKHRSPQSKPSSSLVVSRRANATTAAKAEADNEIESASDDQGAFTLSATVNGNRETLNLGPGWPTDSSPREMPRSISNSNIFDESGERSLLYANLTIGDDEELEELISASNEHAEAGPHPMRSAFSQGQDAQARVLSSGTSNSNVAQAIGGSNMSRSTGLPSARQTSAEGLASTAAGVATPLAKGCSTPRVSLSASSSRASVATTPLTHRTSNKPPVAYDRQKRRPSAAQTTPIGKSHRTNLGASREASTIVSPTKPRLSTATTASRTTPRASLASSSVRRPTALNSATPQPSRQPGRSLAAGAGPTSITRSTSSGSNVATSSSDSKVPALNGGRPALARLAGANPRYGDASARSANAAVRHVATGLPPRRTDSKAPGDGTRSRSGSVDSTATVSGAQSPVQKASAGGQRLSRLLASSNAPDLGSTRRDAYMPDSPTRGADRGFSAEEPMNLADVCTTTREEVLAVAEAPAQTTAAPDVRTRPSDVRPGGTVSRTKSALPAPYVSKRALGRTTSSLPTATGGSRIGRPTKVGTSGPAAPGAKPSGIARPTGLRKPTASAAPRPGGFVSRALAGATESGAAPSAKESATGTSVSGLRAPMTRKQ